MTNAEIEHELRISHQTIIEWTAFFREVCINDVLECSEPIGGNGVEVEKLSKRDSKTLIPIIQKWILPGSIIHSDCWKAYNKLETLGYKHVTVNHSKEFYNEKNAACTNVIESDWRHAKCAMPKYGIHKGMHAGHLAEFLWFHKYDGHDKFITLIEKTNYYIHKGLLAQIDSWIIIW